MTRVDTAILDALNMLLEDERASVEIEVALANGATELIEREAFTTMGTDEVIACCALHERLELLGASVTQRINGIVFRVFGVEVYDERLRAFASYQYGIAMNARELHSAVEDDETRKVLREIDEAHQRDAAWCERRADAFAQSRLVDFHDIKPSAALLPLRLTPPTISMNMERADDLPDDASNNHSDRDASASALGGAPSQPDQDAFSDE